MILLFNRVIFKVILLKRKKSTLKWFSESLVLYYDKITSVSVSSFVPPDTKVKTMKPAQGYRFLTRDYLIFVIGNQTRIYFDVGDG